MSADAWRICPRCQDTLQDQLNDTYGKVPAEEYIRFASHIEEEMQKETFSEYYEIWLDKSGKFNVHYQGQCDVCGLGYAFKTEEQVYTRKYPS
jgi:hypothetical protein